MKRHSIGLTVFLSLFILSALYLQAQTRETAILQGRVLADTGDPLPGVQVKVSSPSVIGTYSAITDREGRYRIPTLLTGTYVVEAFLEGFAPSKIERVVIHAGTTATLDITLSPAKLETEVNVVAAAPVVDVTDASLAKTFISRELLAAVPNSQNTHEIVNMAPGVTEFSAYGGGDQVGNSWTIDGAEVSSAWFGGGQYATPIDYNVVEEAQVIALGAPAEYGGFTGAVINIVTKSGGNTLSGDAQLLFKGRSWQSSNIKAGDPEWVLLPETPITDRLDTSFHLGGPIIRDKLWFFSGFQYLKSETKLLSSGKESPTTMPKYFVKLSFQLSNRDRIQAFFERHTYTNKQSQLSALIHPDGNWDVLWGTTIFNLSYLHTVSADSIFELKFAGTWGSWNSIPSSRDKSISGHWDLVTGESWGNAYWWSDQPDHKINVRSTFSQRADGFLGSHDLKVGAEVEQSGGVWDMTINGGVAYFDLNHEPYMAYTEHGHKGFSNIRWSFFLQDDWKITDSLVINPGIRYGLERGSVPGIDQTVWKPHMGLEPRIGLTWDIFKNQRTVLKAHYGKYNDGVRSYNYWDLTPSGDQIYYLVPEWGTLEYWFTVYGQNLYSVDPNIKIPSMNQLVLGLEQVLGKDLSASAAFIHKKWINFIDTVELNGTYEEVQYTDPDTGNSFTVYNQTNVGTNPHYLITNPRVGADIGAAFPGIVMVDPTRKYTGVQFTISKRFSNRWQFYASYTYSKEEGSYSNAHTATGYYGVGGTGNYHDPNRQINLYGHSTISPPHVLKVLFSYLLPWDINFSAFYRYNSGRTWTRTTTLTIVDQATKPYLLLEPQGSRRMAAISNLDLRVEKTVRVRNIGISLMLDVFNVFNQAAPTSVNVFVGENFGLPLTVTAPRTYRAGLRLFY